jgi:hypothetical protein
MLVFSLIVRRSAPRRKRGTGNGGFNRVGAAWLSCRRDYPGTISLHASGHGKDTLEPRVPVTASCRTSRPGGQHAQAKLSSLGNALWAGWIGQPVAPSSRLPFPDQAGDFPSRCELFGGRLRTVEIGPDLVAHLRFQFKHAAPQHVDLPSDFINSIVHALLEQNKNI